MFALFFFEREQIQGAAKELERKQAQKNNSKFKLRARTQEQYIYIYILFLGRTHEQEYKEEKYRETNNEV